MKEIDKLSIATIRSLCIDMINKANSGHPGMALGSAPILYTLFTKHLIATPKDSKWVNRDRFVLSAGHASSLLYSLLHLCGYKISIDDLKNFRQLGSICPGHPEVTMTDGVDATSGPLGQGIATAVGMAIAEASVQANYHDGKQIMNHYTYALCGDGCLQEGISQEAISFAGHQKLNKLILIYDCNDVTLDGSLEMTFSESVKKRFLAVEWNVLEVSDGNDIDAIDKAISKAKSSDKPTLIIVKTIIGFGSKKQGTNKVHGSPLGVEDGLYAKKEVYGFDHEDLYIPNEVYEHFKKEFNEKNDKIYEKYLSTFEKYKEKHSQDANRFLLMMDNNVDDYIPSGLPSFEKGSQLSTRVASGKALNDFTLCIPGLVGGSADVASSVMTKLNGGEDFTYKCREGHNINWGIREFFMTSAMNGMLLHGGIRTYGGSFFVFCDYMKPAIRMAAISQLPAIYLLSHDSIAVGEDGPTHQPIEHLAMLRSTPNVNVIRPCDERETYAAWKNALRSKKTPTAIILSRQILPLIDNSDEKGLNRGAYIISKEVKKADYVVIATGSEVSLAIEAQKLLLEKGVDVRVVSMPCIEIFKKQDDEYKHEVINLPHDKCISVEMLSSFGWGEFAKYNYSIDTFGTSAPAKHVLPHFGFTPDKLADYILNLGK